MKILVCFLLILTALVSIPVCAKEEPKSLDLIVASKVGGSEKEALFLYQQLTKLLEEQGKRIEPPADARLEVVITDLKKVSVMDRALKRYSAGVAKVSLEVNFSVGIESTKFTIAMEGVFGAATTYDVLRRAASTIVERVLAPK